MALLSKCSLSWHNARRFEFHCSSQKCRFINFEHLKLMQVVRTPDQSSYGNITSRHQFQWIGCFFCTSQSSILKHKYCFFFALSSLLKLFRLFRWQFIILRLNIQNRIASFYLERSSSFQVLFGINYYTRCRKIWDIFYIQHWGREK